MSNRFNQLRFTSQTATQPRPPTRRNKQTTSESARTGGKLRHGFKAQPRLTGPGRPEAARPGAQMAAWLVNAGQVRGSAGLLRHGRPLVPFRPTLVVRFPTRCPLIKTRSFSFIPYRRIPGSRSRGIRWKK